MFCQLLWEEDLWDTPEGMGLPLASNLETLRLIQLCLANYKQTACVRMPTAVYIYGVSHDFLKIGLLQLEVMDLIQVLLEERLPCILQAGRCDHCSPSNY